MASNMARSSALSLSPGRASPRRSLLKHPFDPWLFHLRLRPFDSTGHTTTLPECYGQVQGGPPRPATKVGWPGGRAFVRLAPWSRWSLSCHFCSLLPVHRSTAWDEEARQRLGQHLSICYFRAGQTVQHAGEEPAGLYLIIKGPWKSLPPSILWRLWRGDMFDVRCPV